MSRDHYFAELERTRKDFFYMGDLAKTALADALLGLTGSGAAAAARARTRELEIDALNRSLNEGCLRLMTVGDYADDIAVLVQS